MSGYTFQVVPPAANRYRAPFQGDRHNRLFRSQNAVRIPGLGLLRLHPGRGIQTLPEVALAIHQRDRRQGQAHVRCGSQRIAGQNAQASAVGGKLRSDGDLHGEVGDHAAFTWFLGGNVL